ncbi:MAG: 50S ribosomal protein L25 [Zetaproteobacteria bacterium CG1_02_53_45]|nr:MAG: 50S ribosomal protein L25 [Zetaproteobacteria bacterium CG1_02_53_45]
MSDYIVEAELREETGRAATRRLRRAGKLPGIIYGGGKPDIAITMDYNTVSKLLNEEHFHTSMFDVNVKGSRVKNTVLLKATQYDPLMDTATHIDFLRVLASDSITLEIPVVAINADKCPGVAKGGMIDMIRHALEVTCRADSIPEHIEIDCSKLEMGDSVHIEEIALPAGVEVHHEVNFAVLNVSAPKGAGSSAGEAEETEAESE